MHNVFFLIYNKKERGKTLNENGRKIINPLIARVCDLVARNYYRGRMYVCVLNFVLYVLYRDSFNSIIIV